MGFDSDFIKKSMILVLIVISVGFPFFLFWLEEMSFVFNTSKSLPGFLYLAQKVNEKQIQNLKEGDVIVFSHGLYKGKSLLKKISHQSGEVFKAAALWPSSSYHANTTKHVPFNHVAVQGDHPKSFDSRYEEFGFVPIQTIKGAAWRLF